MASYLPPSAPDGPTPERPARMWPGSAWAAYAELCKPSAYLVGRVWLVQVTLLGLIYVLSLSVPLMKFAGEGWRDTALAIWHTANVPLLVLAATCFTRHLKVRPVRSTSPLIYAAIGAATLTVAGCLIPEDSGSLTVWFFAALATSLLQTIVWCLVIPITVRRRYLPEPGRRVDLKYSLGLRILACAFGQVASIIAMLIGLALMAVLIGGWAMNLAKDGSLVMIVLHAGYALVQANIAVYLLFAVLRPHTAALLNVRDPSGATVPDTDQPPRQSARLHGREGDHDA